MADLGTLAIKLTADSMHFHSEMNKAQTAITRVEDSAGALGNTLAGLGKGLAIAGAAISSAFGIGAGLVLKFTADLEQSEIAWKTLLKSGDAAKAMMSDLQQLAATTPFEFADVERGARRLMAMGFAASEVKPLLVDIGNAASAMGSGAQGIDRITLAIGQMNAKTKVSGEEMRQLTEAGLPAWELLSAHIGKTVGETMKLSEAGKISSATFIEAFQIFSKQNYGDAMVAQSKTFLGALSTIKDSLMIVGSTAFKPIFTRISELAQRIADFVQSDEFTRWGGRVAAVVEVVMDALGQLAQAFLSGMRSILNIVITFGQMIYEALQYLNPFARHSPPLVDDVRQGVEEIVQTYRGIERIQEPLETVRAAVEGFSLAVKTSKTAAQSGLREIERAMDSLKSTTSDLQETVRVLEGRLNRLTRTQIKGTKEYQARMFELEREAARLQYMLNEMKLAGLDPKDKRYKQTAEQLDTLRTKMENMRLLEFINVEPLRRQLKELAEPPVEMPFQQIADGIKETQGQLMTAREELDLSQAAYKELAKAVTVLKDAFADLPKAGAWAAALGDAATGLKDRLDGIEGVVDKWREQQAEWQKSFEAMKREVTTALAPFANIGKDFIQPLIDALDRLAAKLPEIKDTLNTSVIGIRVDFGRLTELVGGTINTILANIGRLGGEIVPLLGPAMANVGKWWREMQRVFSDAGVAIDKIVRGNLLAIQGSIEVALAIIGGIVKVGLALLAGDWDKAGEAIGLAWERTLTGLKHMVEGFFIGIWGLWELGIMTLNAITDTGLYLIIGLWEGATGQIKKKWDEWTQGMQAAWGAFWDGLGTKVNDIAMAIKTTWTDVLNWVIDRINDLIRSFNAIRLELPKVNLPGGGTWGGGSIGVPQIPTIPRLAEGGITTAPTLAMLHPQEAVIPLDKVGSISGQTIRVEFHGPVYGLADLQDVIVSSIENAQRRGRLAIG